MDNDTILFPFQQGTLSPEQGGHIVDQLASAVRNIDASDSLVSSLLEQVIDSSAWMDRLGPNGNRYTFDRAEFIRFIQDPEPRGLGTTKDAIRRYLGDSTNPLRIQFEALAEMGPGNPLGRESNAPRNANGRYLVVHREDDESSIPNIVRDTGDTIESDSVEPIQTPRDRSREPQAGNSIGYAVRRLERQAREDQVAAVALERLRAGEISANAAMIEAGFRVRTVQLPLDPSRAGRLLSHDDTSRARSLRR